MIRKNVYNQTRHLNYCVINILMITKVHSATACFYSTLTVKLYCKILLKINEYIFLILFYSIKKIEHYMLSF